MLRGGTIRWAVAACVECGASVLGSIMPEKVEPTRICSVQRTHLFCQSREVELNADCKKINVKTSHIYCLRDCLQPEVLEGMADEQDLPASAVGSVSIYSTAEMWLR